MSHHRRSDFVQINQVNQVASSMRITHCGAQNEALILSLPKGGRVTRHNPKDSGLYNSQWVIPHERGPTRRGFPGRQLPEIDS